MEDMFVIQRSATEELHSWWKKTFGDGLLCQGDERTQDSETHDELRKGCTPIVFTFRGLHCLYRFVRPMGSDRERRKMQVRSSVLIDSWHRAVPHVTEVAGGLHGLPWVLQIAMGALQVFAVLSRKWLRQLVAGCMENGEGDCLHKHLHLGKPGPVEAASGLTRLALTAKVRMLSIGQFSIRSPWTALVLALGNRNAHAFEFCLRTQAERDSPHDCARYTSKPSQTRVPA